MSVAMTVDAVHERRKTVTRRKGWTFVKPGDRLTLCPKVMGRKKGEPLERICDVEIVDVRQERLIRLIRDRAYGRAEVEAEGFPGMRPVEFVFRYFVAAQDMKVRDLVTRIEWRYLTFHIERFDATWGGWRKVRASDLTEDPATFHTRVEAEAALADLRARSAYTYRLAER